MTGETKFTHLYSTKYHHFFEVWIDHVSWGKIIVQRIREDDTSIETNNSSNQNIIKENEGK